MRVTKTIEADHRDKKESGLFKKYPFLDETVNSF